MKVYRIEFESDRYQSLIWDGDESRDRSPWLEGGELLFDGAIKEDWVCPPLRIYDSSRPAGDFFGVGPGCIGVRDRALELVRTELEIAGQLLPVKVGELAGAILNVTCVVNCLDHERTQWVYGKTTGLPIRCTKWVFRVDLLPESTIFKVSEQVKTSIFVHTGHGESEDSFLDRVSEHQLTGLRFKLVFDDSD